MCQHSPIWEFNGYELQELIRIKDALEVLEEFELDCFPDDVKYEVTQAIISKEEERYVDELLKKAGNNNE